MKWNKKIYVINGDTDLLGYGSNNILPIPDIKVLLDKINKQYDNDLSVWLSQVFELNKAKVIAYPNVV